MARCSRRSRVRPRPLRGRTVGTVFDVTWGRVGMGYVVFVRGVRSNNHIFRYIINYCCFIIKAKVNIFLVKRYDVGPSYIAPYSATP